MVLAAGEEEQNNMRGEGSAIYSRRIVHKCFLSVSDRSDMQGWMCFQGLAVDSTVLRICTP